MYHWQVTTSGTKLQVLGRADLAAHGTALGCKDGCAQPVYSDRHSGTQLPGPRTARGGGSAREHMLSPQHLPLGSRGSWLASLQTSAQSP